MVTYTEVQAIYNYYTDRIDNDKEETAWGYRETERDERRARLQARTRDAKAS